MLRLCSMMSSGRGTVFFPTFPVLVLFASQLLLETQAGKVLGVFDWPGPSHFIMFEALMKGLAARGHQVTVVNHFPQKQPLENYTDISIVGSVPFMTSGFDIDSMLAFGPVQIFQYLWDINFHKWTKTMGHPNVKKLLNSSERFDLVIVELGSSEGTYGFARKFGAPLIAITSFTGHWNLQYRSGFMENPALFPLWVLPQTTSMNFRQRFVNTFWWLYAVLGERFYFYPKVNAYWNKWVDSETPPLEELIRNISLILINAHSSMNGGLPRLPDVVEVGGLHIPEKLDNLPEAMSEWLEGAGEEGVVYVSFGSLARAEDMSLAQLRAMANVLGSLPQRVIWKCHGDSIAKRLGHNLSSNILTAEWMPQRHILAHRNVKVFVSHGGLMGVQEAVYWGKPMMVIPFFADQAQNTEYLLEHGYAIHLDFVDITQESFSAALQELLHNASFMSTARRFSSLFRDRPRTPLQEAVYWSEFVMRHRGAPHRCAGVHLAWWQHWLLDVIAAIFLAVAAATVSSFILLFKRVRKIPFTWNT